MLWVVKMKKDRGAYLMLACADLVEFWTPVPFYNCSDYSLKVTVLDLCGARDQAPGHTIYARWAFYQLGYVSSSRFKT